MISNGIKPILMSFSRVPSASICSSSPRRTWRRSLRISIFFCWNSRSSRLLFGREERFVLLAFRALHLGQLALGVLELLLQFVFLAAEAFLGRGPHVLDRRERTLRCRAATDRDQVGRAGEIVDRIDDEIAVVGERVQDSPAEERLDLHP